MKIQKRDSSTNKKIDKQRSKVERNRITYGATPGFLHAKPFVLRLRLAAMPLNAAPFAYVTDDIFALNGNQAYFTVRPITSLYFDRPTSEAATRSCF